MGPPPHTQTRARMYNFKVVLVMFQAVLHIWSPGYNPRVRIYVLFLVYQAFAPKIRNVCTEKLFPCRIKSARIGYSKILPTAIVKTQTQCVSIPIREDTVHAGLSKRQYTNWSTKTW
jgi:hypothetical protein